MPRAEQAGASSCRGVGMSETLHAITDDEIRGHWRVAADEAAQHRAFVCGENDGRCRHRQANLDECDALLDLWLARHHEEEDVD